MFWNLWRKKRERDIFPFWDGKRDRKADPLAAYRALKADPEFNIDVDTELVASAGDLDSSAKMAAATRRAFGVPPFEAGGLTEGECNTLFWAFMLYLNEKKNTDEPPLTSPEPTESTSPIESSATITKPLSESPLIPTEQNPGMPPG